MPRIQNHAESTLLLRSQRLGCTHELVKCGRRVGNTGGGEGLLVVIEDWVRDAKGHGPLGSIDVPVRKGSRQVIRSGVILRGDAGRDGHERLGVDSGLGIGVGQLRNVGEFASSEP